MEMSHMAPRKLLVTSCWSWYLPETRVSTTGGAGKRAPPQANSRLGRSRPCLPRPSPAPRQEGQSWVSVRRDSPARGPCTRALQGSWQGRGYDAPKASSPIQETTLHMGMSCCPAHLTAPAAGGRATLGRIALLPHLPCHITGRQQQMQGRMPAPIPAQQQSCGRAWPCRAAGHTGR